MGGDSGRHPWLPPPLLGKLLPHKMPKKRIENQRRLQLPKLLLSVRRYRNALAWTTSAYHLFPKAVISISHVYLSDHLDYPNLLTLTVHGIMIKFGNKSECKCMFSMPIKPFES